MIPGRLAFIDLETTGAHPGRDRVTEIGIVEVEGDRVTTWRTLVNPERAIPEFIQHLTGIRDEMVANAPTFAQVADELAKRLRGRLFVAHNARFDYGFVKSEYRRLGQHFRADVVCTVRLSRYLYPQYPRHNLDTLIARHELQTGERHRALADADLIWQFWRVLERERGEAALADAVRQQLNRPRLPPHLDPATLDDLPEFPGVYLLYGENDVLLFVGKGVNLRRRVLSHFAETENPHTRACFSQDVRRIHWRETVGELGAMLLEARLIKERQPTHNRRRYPASDLCSWHLEQVAPGDFRPRLASGQDADFGRTDNLFGLFGSPREANTTLRKIADAYGLCPVILGLEKPAGPGRACSAFSLRQCKGACVGQESIGLHSARMMAALAKLRLEAWTFPGPIGLLERDDYLGLEDVHVVDGWRYLGTARNEAELHELLGHADRAPFDIDTYKLLKAELTKGKVRVRHL
jgi:DNA polymerase III subunit epsilon